LSFLGTIEQSASCARHIALGSDTEGACVESLDALRRISAAAPRRVGAKGSATSVAFDELAEVNELGPSALGWRAQRSRASHRTACCPGTACRGTASRNRGRPLGRGPWYAHPAERQRRQPVEERPAPLNLERSAETGERSAKHSRNGWGDWSWPVGHRGVLEDRPTERAADRGASTRLVERIVRQTPA
jgi:hypothetical protein